jgi:hypothetical protein
MQAVLGGKLGADLSEPNLGIEHRGWARRDESDAGPDELEGVVEEDPTALVRQ